MNRLWGKSRLTIWSYRSSVLSCQTLTPEIHPRKCLRWPDGSSSCWSRVRFSSKAVLRHVLVSFERFQHPVGSFINWAHIASHTWKASERLTDASPTLIEIARVDSHRDSTTNSHCWRQVLNLWPSKVASVVEQWHSVQAGRVQILGRTWLFQFRIAVYLFSLGVGLSLRKSNRTVHSLSSFSF